MKPGPLQVLSGTFAPTPISQISWSSMTAQAMRPLWKPPNGPVASDCRSISRSKPAQIVVGSRYLNDNDGFKSSFMRRLGGQLISRTLGICFGPCKITDPTSGFRLMDRKAIEFFSRHYPTDFPEPISIAWALANGLEVVETPVVMRKRQAGTSSIRMFKTWSYMIRVVVYIVLARMTFLSE